MNNYWRRNVSWRCFLLLPACRFFDELSHAARFCAQKPRRFTSLAVSRERARVLNEAMKMPKCLFPRRFYIQSTYCCVYLLCMYICVSEFSRKLQTMPVLKCTLHRILFFFSLLSHWCIHVFIIIRIYTPPTKL
jgi:hypothetical protein